LMRFEIFQGPVLGSDRFCRLIVCDVVMWSLIGGKENI
jgi:hypothetical protein